MIIKKNICQVPLKKINDLEVPPYILGDDGFPLRIYLLKVF
jgi:hypothetical protein